MDIWAIANRMANAVNAFLTMAKMYHTDCGRDRAGEELVADRTTLDYDLFSTEGRHKKGHLEVNASVDTPPIRRADQKK